MLPETEARFLIEAASRLEEIHFNRWKMTIEIVDFPINSMVIFHSYVKLPEGIWIIFGF